MQLLSDVVSIVLLYVKPMAIHGFFSGCGIDFGFKFRYDARPYELSIEKLNYIFGAFPNVRLIGVNLVNVTDENLWKLMLCMRKVKRLRICGKYTMCRYSHSFNLHDMLTSVEKFPTCSNVRNLELCYIHGNNLKMFDAPNLKKISIIKCYNDESNILNMFTNNIQTIVLDSICITHKTLLTLGRFSDLKTLVFRQCWKYITNYYEPFVFTHLKNVRRLEICTYDNGFVRDAKFPSFLRHLVICNWPASENPSMLYEYTNLRTLIIPVISITINNIKLDSSRFKNMRLFQIGLGKCYHL